MGDRIGELDAVAHELHAARTSVQATEQFAGRVELTLAEAYDIQLRSIRLREDQGERTIGLKLGLTSREKAKQMGVSDVILGVLTDRMQIATDGEIDVTRTIHPRVEPEIAFRMAEDLPFDVLTRPEGLLPYVTHVAAALEVIDSRYRNFRFDLQDVVADNTSGSYFVVGEWQDFTTQMRQDALGDLDVVMRIDDQTVATGTTRAILDDPLEALNAVARLATRHGHVLVPGATILAGSATAAIELAAGVRVEVNVDGLATASVRTKVQAPVSR